MVNDKVLRNLKGVIYGYVCQCGSHWYPEPSHGFTMCPGEQIFGEGSCPDRNYGLTNKPHKRPKYRKMKPGQATLEGLDVNKAFWGITEQLTENFLKEK